MGWEKLSDEEWGRQVSGEGCPFCSGPEKLEWLFSVAGLSASGLFLPRDQALRGKALLVWRGRHVRSFSELSGEEARALSADMVAAHAAVEAASGAEQMNAAWLGNRLAHLHCHLIPRFKSDPFWGGPPWGSEPLEPRVAGDEELEALAGKIRAKLRELGALA